MSVPAAMRSMIMVCAGDCTSSRVVKPRMHAEIGEGRGLGYGYRRTLICAESADPIEYKSSPHLHFNRTSSSV